MSSGIEGIDVSYAQGKVNWESVASSNKFSFAVCKATEGLTKVDPQFQRNWAGIKSVNLIRGAYHFARPKNDPLKEAEHFCSTVQNIELGDVLVLDIEESPISGQFFVDWVFAWLHTVEQKMGVMPIIYTGGPFFTQHAGKLDQQTSDKFKQYPLWIAAYTTSPDKFVPSPWKDVGWTIWQCSGDVAAKGESIIYLPGTKTVVDRNKFKGSVEDLKKIILNLSVPTQNTITTAVSSIINQKP